jgi:hypothetical protein
LIDGGADRLVVNQYDRRNYHNDESWISSRDSDCSAAALDWFLGVYRRTLGGIDAATALIGPNPGTSTTRGLLDARGPALSKALAGEGPKPRTPGARPLGSVSELQSWLDQGPLRMDGAL